MRVLPSCLAAAIASGAARLCTAFVVTRTDGVTMGFTDHDRDLLVDGVACAAATGLTAGAADQTLGDAAGTASVSGALVSGAITEADIAAGLYDGAVIQAWRVDWSDPASRVLLWWGVVSRLQRDGQAFVAEVEGPLQALERVAGRTYQRQCDAALGDSRCRADVSAAAFNGAGVVAAVLENRRLTTTGLETFAAGWFAGGLLAWSAGANAGRTMRVAAHLSGGVLVLESPAAGAVAVGDAFAVQAGCDKAMATCASKFANLMNFQGFPDIPGDDFLAAVPVDGALNDGGSRR